MKTQITFPKRLMSLLLCAAMVFSFLPVAASAADVAGEYYNRVVDVNTMDNWSKYFSPTDVSTANAGGVWRRCDRLDGYCNPVPQHL